VNVSPSKVGAGPVALPDFSDFPDFSLVRVLVFVQF
jgi:hypothetical protein